METKIEVQEPKKIDSNEKIIDGVKVVTFSAYGTFWERFGAHMLNKIALQVPLLNIGVFFYNIVVYFSQGTTLGYNALKLRIVDASTGKKPTEGALFLRWLYRIMLQLVLPFVIVMVSLATETPSFMLLALLVWLGVLVWYMVSILNSEKKQAPYDEWTNCIVVKSADNTQTSSSGIIVAVIVGFLMIIPIIGILSAVVLTSLNSAREKAMDAKTVNDIKQTALALELARDQNTGEFLSGVTTPTDGLSVYLDPFPFESNEEFTWLDNSQNPNTFCMYAQLDNTESGEYFYASSKGSGYTDQINRTLENCGE